MERSIYNRGFSDELEEIITTQPKWILRYGIAFLFLLLVTVISLTSLIRYPDIIKTTLIINASNSPKSVYGRKNGKLVRLLVQENQKVEQDQPLAYLESTASHGDVLKLLDILNKIHGDLVSNKKDFKLDIPINLKLGELQQTYQQFYQDYLKFISTKENGYYLKKKSLLIEDIKSAVDAEALIENQREIQSLEAKNREKAYEAHKKLFEKKMISKNEFMEEENRYLSSKYPLTELKRNLIENKNAINSRKKELTDLDNVILQEKLIFLQSINRCISEISSWSSSTILKAPIKGTAIFVGIMQENQSIAENQEVFIINPEDSEFFGLCNIHQYNMGTIEVGQEVNIKLRSYPYEKFGVLNGKLSKISDIAYHDSIFVAKIDLLKYRSSNKSSTIILKNGMIGDAEIITTNQSLFTRLTSSLINLIR